MNKMKNKRIKQFLSVKIKIKIKIKMKIKIKIEIKIKIKIKIEITTRIKIEIKIKKVFLPVELGKAFCFSFFSFTPKVDGELPPIIEAN